ncbi:hypothetical protein [Pararhizobium sp.]|uniref:hypothetical protein n=1 Tax=Pararhizobium sp. TaxID=1977563 RepID=UPI003D1192A9
MTINERMNALDEARSDAASLFSGPGEVRSLARELDWSKTPMGPTSGWSPAVRLIARSMFDSPFPICLWSGPDFALVYNDPYRRILAAKHPAALGQPGSVVWAEIWDQLKPQFDDVRSGGDTVYFEDAPFVMARLEGSGTETAWFNYSLSPLRDEDGSIAAVLNITPENTSRVLVERRLIEEQAALAANEERLRLAVANADVGLWDVDLVEDTLIWPERTKAMFGISADVPVTLDDFYNGLHPADREATTTAFLAAADPELRALSVNSPSSTIPARTPEQLDPLPMAWRRRIREPSSTCPFSSRDGSSRCSSSTTVTNATGATVISH